MLEWNGERYLPFIDPNICGAEIHYEHLHRYAFASLLGKDACVLDLASGEGYGSYMISKRAKQVIGIDIDPVAVAHARVTYQKPNLRFCEGRIDRIPIEGERIFDVIVCFEAIEHIESQEELLLEVKRLLKEDGIFIVSTPNKRIYTDADDYSNPFHVKELYYEEFEHLLKEYFEDVRYYGQKVFVGSNLFQLTPYQPLDIKEFFIGYKDEAFVFGEGDERTPRYYVAVAGKKDSLKELHFFDSYLVDSTNIEICQFNQQVGKFSNELNVARQIMEDRFSRINQLGEQVQAAESIIKERDIRVNQLSEQVQAAESVIKERDIRINQLSEQVQAAEQQIIEKDADLKELQDEVSQLTNENWVLTTDLAGIRKSIGYRFTERFQTVFIERFFPVNTKKRQAYDRFLMGGRMVINDGFHKFIICYRDYKKTKRRFAEDAHLKAEQGYTYRDQRIAGEPEFTSQRDTLSTDFVPLSEKKVTLTPDDVKLIAFYLPQYHPIPENDMFWGKGFTDWINVAKAVPQFVGHYQPHLPGELGFYDLRLIEVQKRQIELARQYGIYGFCFHYYWFNGKRLLEKPLFQFLEHIEWDFPFCICYANENWTRRWDGMEHDILISQKHSPEDDLEFIKDLEDVLKDPRYIKIDGKPILIVYRVQLLPDPHRTVEIWRAFCREKGIGELYLIAAQTFGFEDPRPYNFDAAVEFPPHHPLEEFCKVINNQLPIINPHFSGEILNIEPYIRSKKFLRSVEYALYKTVSPGWDNTPRRSGKAKILYGLNPARYEEWLSGCMEYTRKHRKKEERFVFINAWNEWAEGAYLEPDRRYGYSFLQKTADAILNLRQAGSANKKIIVVSHDALLYGAQMIALNLVKTLKVHFNYDISVILKAGGPLEKEFTMFAKVYNLQDEAHDPDYVKRLIKELSNQGFSTALCNSVASGDLIEIFAENQVRTVSLIHELPGIIQDYGIEKNAASISKYADRLIFPSEFVKEHFTRVYPSDEQKTMIAPQGLYFKNKYKDKKEEARNTLRTHLGLPEQAKVILAVGSADYRKGADVFFEVAKEVTTRNPLAYFVWIGPKEQGLVSIIQERIIGSNLQERIRFVGERREDLDLFYSGSDLFLMSSREDPYPSVVMEAMDAGLPVIGFDDAGGFTEIVTRERGILVSYLDIGGMTRAVEDLLQNKSLMGKLGKNASDFASKQCKFLDYVYTVLSAAGHAYKKVSVILPNYNHGRYLDGRMKSIVHQSYPVYEVIFLDDCSNDDSVAIMTKIMHESPLDITIIRHSTNSGSIFKQWSEGITRAQGEYVWITEADDYALPGFLSNVMKGFDDEDVILSYAQSKQIDENGDLIAPDYLPYTNDIDPEKWLHDYIVDGTSEITTSLVVKNTIPNVSGVVFKKVDISEIIPEIIQFRVCGDWRFYVWILQKGKIAYFKEPLNLHRRYSASVTGTTKAQQHFQEIVTMQDYILNNFDVQEEVKIKVYHYREEVFRYLMNQGS
jgi:glycosyltransferase involved in cell wall biosynthesis/2-polyprenyl-3-methyl-5-hydroxy-6-metoxy-1,4-benzoquinol methylase/regulator of replication initiation timing